MVCAVSVLSDWQSPFCFVMSFSLPKGCCLAVGFFSWCDALLFFMARGLEVFELVVFGDGSVVVVMVTMEFLRSSLGFSEVFCCSLGLGCWPKIVFFIFSKSSSVKKSMGFCIS